jgi:hypothetical protein
MQVLEVENAINASRLRCGEIIGGFPKTIVCRGKYRQQTKAVVPSSLEDGKKKGQQARGWN